MALACVLGVLVAAFLLWDRGQGGSARGPAEPSRPRLRTPAAPTTVAAAGDAAGLAAAATAALFDSAPVVVVASEEDRSSPGWAADAAAGLGMPLLVAPARGSGRLPAPRPADELRRLAPRAVLAFGPAAGGWARRHGGGAPVVTAPSGPPRQADLRARLPAVAPAEPLDEVLVLVQRGAAQAVAAASARASGARVVAVAGPDPRADPTAIDALAAAPLPPTVVALGAFGPPDLLRARLGVAATGTQLPAGGQVVFPDRRMVALYGHPGAPALGALGEQPVGAAVARVQRLAAGYDRYAAEPVVPAFEIIATVASSAAGPDGDYSDEATVADLRPWVDAAARAGVYVVLDLQPGRTDFLTQARRYEELLARSHVGLALDPEWRLGPGQRHLDQIGTVGADEVNAVADWLAGLTRQHRLPQKLLLLHQFRLQMIGDRARVDTDHDELAVLVHADGHGSSGEKLATWRNLRSQPLPGAWWGWKNFIDEDRPTFTPGQTMALRPAPWFVSYQ